MKKSLNYLFTGVLVFLLLSSCIKDTDFDQADAIVLSPVVELDLIYFNLNSSDFYDSDTSTSILTVRDTTIIDFLDDPEIQESLKRAEFYFKFTNSISRDFQVDFQFLSEENDTTYTAQTTVIEGALDLPVVTEFTENVEGDSIIDLTMATKVVVSVTISTSNANLEGDLNLQSKTTYFLEFQ